MHLKVDACAMHGEQFGGAGHTQVATAACKKQIDIMEVQFRLIFVLLNVLSVECKESSSQLAR